MLRRLLAGPILRRTEPSRVVVWVATSEPVDVGGAVVDLENGSRGAILGQSGATRRVRLGERLFVHLVEIRPDGNGGFPTGRVLGYDLQVGDDDLGDLGLLSGARDITLAGLPLPSFTLRAPGEGALTLLHGSCRLLHGKGEDSLPCADELLRSHARHPARRPTLFVLTGDQIYGDEVAGPLAAHLRSLATELIGPDDERSVPGLPPLPEIPLYGRAELVRQRASFTSGKADNHLASFGEFAAMYLVAWDEGNWPDTLPEAPTGLDRKQQKRFADEASQLGRTREALPAARRVLANVPVYTTADDHDVTDDWNLDGAWRQAVHDSPTGRRIVANALATYWAFQGWGNQPELFDGPFLAIVSDHLSGDQPDDDAFDHALWSFDRWSYVTPTDPPVVVLDTRTRRGYDEPSAAARLIDQRERDRIAELIRGSGFTGTGPLVLVSAVPVFGLELQERRQKFFVGKVGPYEIDFEAWHSNLAGMIDFMHLLIDEVGLRSAVLLSGDVHYGLNVEATFQIDDRVLTVAQLVSSSFKHSGTLSKTGLDLLGRVVTREHLRVGWDTPPALDGHRTRWRDRLLARPANTDAWDDDAPVFLSPGRARKVRAHDQPRYREGRRYVCPGGSSTVVIGENNLGLVSIDGTDVEHRLLSRGADGTAEHVAHLSCAPTASEAVE